VVFSAARGVAERTTAAMRPAGYLYKHVVQRPEWLKAPLVHDVRSLSGCISKPFADYVDYWKHNGFWLFDSPAVIEAIAAQASIDLSTLRLFYYEMYEREFDAETKAWSALEPAADFPTAAVPPRTAELQGYDVTTFSCRTTPECSPLSCNGLAATLPVNQHCLFDTFADAQLALERGAFDHSEPGPFRISAVYVVPR
jgi:hypothetical protein